MKFAFVPVFLLVGPCHRVSSGPGEVAPSVQRWAPPPQSVEYLRINVAGEVALPDSRIRDVWQGPRLDGEVLVYDVTSYDITINPDAGKRLDATRVFYGSQGFGYLGTIGADGGYERWVPPQVVLPPNPRVGDSWSATHQKGASVSERGCEILDSDFCAEGLVVICDSKRDGGRIILRDHFCPGVGWGGFEALVQAGEQPTIRMWSEELVRDGLPVPDPVPAAGE